MYYLISATTITLTHKYCFFFFFWQLLLFGGHGTGGWLSRYDIYYNDCVVLDRGVYYLPHPSFFQLLFPTAFVMFLAFALLLNNVATWSLSYVKFKLLYT